MRRLIAAVAVTVGLLLGPMALPAAAHHTHSPTTICNLTKPAGHTVIGARQYTVIDGHPIWAACRSNNLSVFGDADRCWRANYQYHTRTSYQVC